VKPSSTIRRATYVLLGAVVALAVTAHAAVATETSAWQDQKCAAYQAAWEKLTASLDLSQVNYAFLAGNENFIASGCLAHDMPICARSDVELEAANALTLVAMNAGAASTFLPFRCPPEGGGAWEGPGL
jgi:hypothetical protein